MLTFTKYTCLCVSIFSHRQRYIITVQCIEIIFIYSEREHQALSTLVSLFSIFSFFASYRHILSYAPSKTTKSYEKMMISKNRSIFIL
jgi:hypothetical protein